MIGDKEGLILLFWVPAMLQLKLWSVMGASHHPVYMDNYCSYNFYPFLASSWVILQGNEDVRSAQHVICCLCVLCKSKKLGGRGSTRFPSAMMKIIRRFSFSYRKLLDRVAFRILSKLYDGALLQKYVEHLQIIGLMVVMMMVFCTCGELVRRGVGAILRNWMDFRDNIRESSHSYWSNVICHGKCSKSILLINVSNNWLQLKIFVLFVRAKSGE